MLISQLIDALEYALERMGDVPVKIISESSGYELPDWDCGQFEDKDGLPIYAFFI